MKNSQNIATPIFQLKGSLFTLTTFHLLDVDLMILNEQLTALTQQAPKFFQQTPLIIDLQKLNSQHKTIDLHKLFAELQQHGLRPLGIRHATPAQQESARALGLALFPEAKADPVSPPKEGVSSESLTMATTAKTHTTTPSATTKSISKLITQPVRSGQQIYAQDGDLVILSTVSPGAELLADGHIHVYGPLRGRALAGVSGNTQARIFCKSLEAELIAIAGHYCVNEDLKTTQVGQATQIYLEDDRLRLTTL